MGVGVYLYVFESRKFVKLGEVPLFGCGMLLAFCYEKEVRMGMVLGLIGEGDKVFSWELGFPV